jgi:hypothetical protein
MRAPRPRQPAWWAHISLLTERQPEPSPLEGINVEPLPGDARANAVSSWENLSR